MEHFVWTAAESLLINDGVTIWLVSCISFGGLLAFSDNTSDLADDESNESADARRTGVEA